MKAPTILTITLLIIALPTPAQISTDGTLGQSINLQGPNFQIGAALGQQHGPNLFHSFRDFNLSHHESANFSGPSSVQNILSRVTGGNPSHIDGLFRSTISGANMYFLNPYGIIFGPNARLDVQGSFHASTADYLRLGENGRFDVRNPSDSILTIAPIEAFGFLTDSPTAITLHNSQLSVPNHQTLSLIGGDIQIQGTSADRDDKTREPMDDQAVLAAESGRINLASVAMPNELRLTASDLNWQNTEPSGSVTASNTMINVTGDGGGSLFIRGGDVRFTNTQIDSKTSGNQDGGLIDIQAENLFLTQGTELFAPTTSTGKATTIHLHATDTVEFSGMNQTKRASTINANSLIPSPDGGDASDILITARQVSFLEGAHIYSVTTGGGDASQVTIQADDSITFSGVDSSGWRIAGLTTDSISKADGAGDAGSLLLEAKNITFEQGGGMQSGTAGQGNLGNVTIRATEQFTMKGYHKDETGSPLVSRVMDSSNGGQGGELLIEAGEMIMQDGAYISASTNGPGKGGTITLHVNGTLTLIGGEQVEQKVTRIISDSRGGSRAKTVGEGGSIVLTAGQLIIKDGSIISTSARASKTKLAGKAGEIHITVTGDVLLSGFNQRHTSRSPSGSGIYASSQGFGDNSDDAGQITIEAGSLTLEEGATIISSTNNDAQGGNIDIQVTDTVKIIGHTLPLETNQSTSGIYARSESSGTTAGPSGDITLRANLLSITDQGRIETATAGSGKAGQILIDVGRLQMDNRSAILSGSQLPNTFQFATISERDSHIIILGDVIEVADDGDGYIISYVNTGNDLLQGTFVYTVANLAELHELSKHYNLKEGYIVEVADIGARFVYSYNSSYDMENWIQLSDQPIEATFETVDELLEQTQHWFKSPALVPYSSGTLIQVNDMGNGKPAQFVYSADIVLPNGRIEGAPIRISSFNVANTAALNQITEQKFLANGDMATVSNQTRFVFYDQQWIPLTGNHIQAADLSKILEGLSQAQTGNIAKVADAGSGQPVDFIYTGRNWIPLNVRYEVANLVQRDQIPAETGDIVKVANAGKGETFFYADGTWIKQIKGGQAGTITIHASEGIHLSAHSQMTTEAVSAGGGTITIEASPLVELTDSRITTSVQEGLGNGGDITVSKPMFVIMDNGKIIAQAYEGRGGNIRISSKELITSPDSLVSASSRLGIDGKVDIESPAVNLDDFLVVLPDGYDEIQLQLPKGCTVEDILNPKTTFQIRTVPEGLPETPDSFME